jgi:hypothetical protein
MISRRLFIGGLLAGTTAAPAIVKASSLMKIKPVGPFPLAWTEPVGEPWYAPAGIMRGYVGRIEGIRIMDGDRVLIQDFVCKKPSLMESIRQTKGYDGSYIIQLPPDDSTTVYEALRKPLCR